MSTAGLKVRPYYMWWRSADDGRLILCLECSCGEFTFDVPETGFACPTCGAAYAPPRERDTDG